MPPPSASSSSSLRALLPLSFGKGGRDRRDRDGDEDGDENGDHDDGDVRGQPPPPPPPPQQQQQHDEDEEDEEQDQDEDQDQDDQDATGPTPSTARALPVTSRIALRDHTRAVSALTLDPAGARLISGGHDFALKFWDFNGMDRNLRPFRSAEPCGSFMLRDVHYSVSGDTFLVAPSSAQARLFDREGRMIVEYIKGDPYIRDMNNTKGHISAITSCEWHPVDKTTFMTTSEDFSVRLWDAQYEKKHKQVMVARSTRPGERMSVSVGTFSTDGKLVTAGCVNGSIKLWPCAGPYHRPSMEVHGHMAGAHISSLRFFRDGFTLASRACDDTLKLWDIRKFKVPLLVKGDLPNVEERCDVVISPDEQIIATGTSIKPNEGTSRLLLFKRNTLELAGEAEVSGHSISRLLWHPRINQIVVGDTNGVVTMFYDPAVSVKGALLCANRAPKRSSSTIAADSSGVGTIITPHALPMFREEKPKSLKRKAEKLRKDPVASHRPEPPVDPKGRGGRIGGAGSFTHHVYMQKIVKDTSREEDPREALLKYAKIAEAEPMFVSVAYKDTQPKPVFDLDAHEDEGAERETKRPT